RTRCLGAGLDDLVIELLRVNHATVRDRENQRGARRRFRVEFQLRVLERGKAGDNGKARDRARSAQPWMRRRLGGRFRRNSKNRMRATERTREPLCLRHFTIQQTPPDMVQAAAQWCNPTHSGDVETHAEDVATALWAVEKRTRSAIENFGRPTGPWLQEAAMRRLMLRASEKSRKHWCPRSRTSSTKRCGVFRGESCSRQCASRV